jgi:hypothetical protein
MVVKESNPTQDQALGRQEQILLQRFQQQREIVVHFEYYVVNGTGAARTGVVMAVWNGSSGIFTDTSTTDLNGTTEGIAFIVYSLRWKCSTQRSGHHWSLDSQSRDTNNILIYYGNPHPKSGGYFFTYFLNRTTLFPYGMVFIV